MFKNSISQKLSIFASIDAKTWLESPQKFLARNFKVWLILFQILWKVLLPKSKKRNEMSHRFQKLLKRHLSTFLEILYRTVVFLKVFVEEIFKVFKNSIVIILPPINFFKKISQKSKIPLKLWSLRKFQTNWILKMSWNQRQVFAMYFWSLGTIYC